VLAGRLASADLARVLARFSRYGVGLVAVVLASGLLSAWRRTGTWDNLTGSSYGQILIVKVAVVAAMGAAALRNRNRHTPRLGHGDMAVQADARAGLRRTIAVELALGLLVIGLAIWLGAAEAPR
jgi:putative copper export protein